MMKHGPAKERADVCVAVHRVLQNLFEKNMRKHVRQARMKVGGKGKTYANDVTVGIGIMPILADNLQVPS